MGLSWPRPAPAPPSKLLRRLRRVVDDFIAGMDPYDRKLRSAPLPERVTPVSRSRAVCCFSSFRSWLIRKLSVRILPRSMCPNSRAATLVAICCSRSTRGSFVAYPCRKSCPSIPDTHTRSLSLHVIRRQRIRRAESSTLSRSAWAICMAVTTLPAVLMLDRRISVKPTVRSLFCLSRSHLYPRLWCRASCRKASSVFSPPYLLVQYPRTHV